MKTSKILFVMAVIFSAIATVKGQTAYQPDFKKDRKINVAFFVFDQVEALDLNGPIDILAKANHIDPVYNLYTVSLTKAPVVTEGNVLTMQVTYSIANAPQADILILPGGSPDLIVKMCADHPELIRWISQQNVKTKITMSVCTGAFFLSSAGILDGKEATTHNLALEKFSENKKIKVLEDLRFVQDGKVITTAGITSGFDGTLHLVDMINGKKVADQISKLIIYNRNGDMSFMKAEDSK